MKKLILLIGALTMGVVVFANTCYYQGNQQQYQQQYQQQNQQYQQQYQQNQYPQR